MESVSAKIINRKIVEVDKGKCPAKIVMVTHDGTRREVSEGVLFEVEEDYTCRTHILTEEPGVLFANLIALFELIDANGLTGEFEEFMDMALADKKMCSGVPDPEESESEGDSGRAEHSSRSLHITGGEG